MAWEATWARHGISDDSLPVYVRHLGDVQRALGALRGPPVIMRNKIALVDAIVGFILSNAVAPQVLQRVQARPAPFRMSA
jgi:hypothetical protein